MNKNNQLEIMLDIFIKRGNSSRRMKTKAHLYVVGAGREAASCQACHPQIPSAFGKAASIAIVLLTLFAFQIPEAKAVIWDEEYLGIDFLSTPWSPAPVAERTVTDPPETWVRFNGSEGDVIATMDNSTYWNAGDTFTIEFSMAIMTAGTNWAQGLWAFAGAEGDWQLVLNTNGLALNGINYATTLTLGEAFVYRLVVDAGVGAVYLNDAPTAVISGVSPGAVVPGYELLWAGDWGGGLDGDGQWNSISWNNSEAIAPVPEPTSAMLMIGSLCVFAMSRRCRR